jgi:hypothetical protein
MWAALLSVTGGTVELLCSAASKTDVLIGTAKESRLLMLNGGLEWWNTSS